MTLRQLRSRLKSNQTVGFPALIASTHAWQIQNPVMYSTVAWFTQQRPQIKFEPTQFENNHGGDISCYYASVSNAVSNLQAPHQLFDSRIIRHL
jgi:hypothetical protein